MKKSLKGFTLVEMLIVISIIAILSGAILAGMGSSRTKARNAKVVANVNTLQLIMENAYTDGSYPTGPNDTNISASDIIKANAIIATGTGVSYCPADADVNGNITSYRIQGVLEAGKDADDILKSSLTSAINSCTCDKAADSPEFCVGE